MIERSYVGDMDRYEIVFDGDNCATDCYMLPVGLRIWCNLFSEELKIDIERSCIKRCEKCMKATRKKDETD